MLGHFVVQGSVKCRPVGGNVFALRQIFGESRWGWGCAWRLKKVKKKKKKTKTKKTKRTRRAMATTTTTTSS